VYIRLFAVLAVDAIDRFANPLGASGQELCDITLIAGTDDALGDARRNLNAIKRNHFPFLNYVRNSAIAHQPRNAREELETLESIDVAHAFRAFQMYCCGWTRYNSAYLHSCKFGRITAERRATDCWTQSAAVKEQRKGKSTGRIRLGRIYSNHGGFNPYDVLRS
jgi:hypothetical protein